jgi:hypothetical protein
VKKQLIFLLAGAVILTVLIGGSVDAATFESPPATPTSEVTPNSEPTASPTLESTTIATLEPTAIPTLEPTATATLKPTNTPTLEPTTTPIADPTLSPEPTNTPLPSTPVNQSVASFTLVNSETNQDIGPLVDGSVITLDSPPQKLNIRANTNPEKVGSVLFDLNGKARRDNSSPYALFGDKQGNYKEWRRPKAGQYTLTAIPYSERKGQGIARQSLTISFAIEYAPSDQAVTGFTLVNAETNQDIGPLTDGAVIGLNAFDNKRFNIRANTDPETVGSVLFTLNDKTRRDNKFPYAVFGDKDGNYRGWKPREGGYTLVAQPFTQRGGKGAPGQGLSISFTITRGEPVPTVTPSPSPTPTQSPNASVPLCVNHDPTAWHSLYNAADNCRYDHEHKQDPSAVNDIFGPVGALYGGQEISYPWQTFSTAGTENDLKHGGYGWLVTRDMGCSSAYSDGCLTDFRVQYHAIMSAHGAVTRFHSFWLEARGCREDNPDRCGIIRTGGWADYGELRVDGQHIPLPVDPTESVPGRRVHHYNKGNKNFGTWYGNNRMAVVALQTPRMWGLINPDNPFELHLFCPDLECKNNNSQMQAHIIGFRISSKLDTDGDGLVTYQGYTDRYGNLITGCTSVGLDCVPLEIIDMPVGSYQFRDDRHGLGDAGRGDFDLSPPGEWWVGYPN